jgi:hypothetical protein
MTPIDDMEEERGSGDTTFAGELYESLGSGTDLDKNFEEEVEREVEGERIKDNLWELVNQLDRVRAGLLEKAKYPRGHPHLRELPAMKLSSLPRWVAPV